MKKRWITAERVVAITASLFLTISLVASILMNGDPKCIIPHTEIVIPAVHAFCLLLALVCIFVPSFYLEFAIMQIEAALTIMTDLPFLGIFLFYGSVFLFMCQPIPFKKMIYFLTNFCVIHVITILLSYTHGWTKTLMGFSCSIFYGAFFAWIYIILKTKFECFTPARIKVHSQLSRKVPGDELKLSDYNLTPRQQSFIIDNVVDKMTYKGLSEKYNVSLSTVKKEFTTIFEVFGVAKLEELHLLLLQYKIVE